MIGRMTSSQTVRNFLADLQENNRLLDRAQHQVSTGKRISSPADDPLGIAQSLRLRGDQGATAAWSANIDDSLTWLNTTDAAMDNATQVIQRARELAVQGANGALSTSARATLADEVDALRGQMVEIGNTALGGRFIFGGTLTQTQPFDAAGTYSGSTSLLQREVGQGTVLSVNITGDRLAGPGGGVPDVFATLTTLAADLRSSNVPGIGGQALTNLDTHLNNVSNLRGELAGKVNRLEVAQSRFATVGIATSEQLSKVEDADMALAITELKTREDLYRSTLGVGGRVLKPSLLDFLS